MITETKRDLRRQKLLDSGWEVGGSGILERWFPPEEIPATRDDRIRGMTLSSAYVQQQWATGLSRSGDRWSGRMTLGIRQLRTMREAISKMERFCREMASARPEEVREVRYSALEPMRQVLHDVARGRRRRVMRQSGVLRFYSEESVD